MKRGQEDILENNRLSLSFAVSSECELEHSVRVFLISNGGEFTVVENVEKTVEWAEKITGCPALCAPSIFQL